MNWALEAAEEWAEEQLHVSMVTCDGRQVRAKRTLERLNRAGLRDIHVHQNDLPLGHDNLVLNFGQAMAGFLESRMPWWLFCEDDIIVRRDLIHHVAVGTHQGKDIIAYCVIGKTCVPDLIWKSNVMAQRRFERYEFHPLPRIDRFFGSQCVLLTRKAAILIDAMNLLGNPKPSGGFYYFDDLLAKYGQDHDGLWGYFPNVVQHIGGKKMWSKCPSPTAVSSTFSLQPKV